MTWDTTVDIVSDGRPPIIQYWHEEVPPDDVDDLLSSFREHNPHLPHHVFNETTAEALIEGHFDSRYLDAFRACAVPAMQADYFRYCAVLALGGVYCDADERCVGDLRPLIPCGNGAVLFELPQFGLIVNGLFAFGRRRHPFLELALEIATANIEHRRLENVFLATGPLIFSCIYWSAKLGSFEAMINRAERQAESLRGIGRLGIDSWDPGGMATILRSYCEAIGDYHRVANVLDGVRVLRFNERGSFVCSGGALRYRDGDSHYQHWGARGWSIFR